LVDTQGRRTGYYHGWVEDIPNCRLEALQDEIAEAHDYSFYLDGGCNQSDRLLVEPRTEGSLSVECEGTLAGKRACIANADTLLVSGEHEWLLR
jgi:hypothetical protein